MAAVARRSSSSKGLTFVNELSMKEELRKLLPSMRPSTLDSADDALSQSFQGGASGYHTNGSLPRNTSLPKLTSSAVDERKTPKLKSLSLPNKDSNEQAVRPPAQATLSFSQSVRPPAQTPLAPPLPAPDSKAPPTNFAGGRSVSMHALLAAAQRNIDFDDLPARGSRPTPARPQQGLERREEPIPAKKADVTFSSSFKLAEPAAAISQAPPGGLKPLKERTWSSREEAAKLSSELARLGKQPKKMNWASNEIENAWLRKEVTSQLLQTLATSAKPSDTDLLDDDNASTRAPSSAIGSSRLLF